MRKLSGALFLGLTLIFAPFSLAEAHFGMVIPSDQMVMPGDPKTVQLRVMFWHPFEGVGLDLEKPAAFGVAVHGEKADLLGELKPVQVKGHQAWETSYRLGRPGVYAFFLEPRPYWEPAEEVFIVHYTKVYVAAFGVAEGWDQPLGLKTEIVPLTQPFGLYAGNVFQGRVLLKGQPVPFAEVEVEYYNQAGRFKAPTDYMVTQTLKADPNGVFTYAAPWAGWWGFAALSVDEGKLKQGGQDREVEIGAVLWVRFHEPE